MVIMKMNNMLTKHSRVLFGIFTLVIIVSFVWFFTPGMDGSMFFGNDMSSQSAVVGKVFGEKVTRGELRADIARRTLVLAATYGGNPQNYAEYALQEAFESFATLRAAKRMGITVSDEDVVRQIRMIPIFQGKNGFDSNLYKKYVEEYLVPAGYTASDLEEAFRDALTQVNFSARFAENAVVTPGEILDAQNATYGKVDYKTVKFLTDIFAKDLKLTEQELMDFHNANNALFMTEPSVNVLIIPFFNSKYTKDIEISTDAVKEYYEANKDKFTKDGKLQPFENVAASIRETLTKSAAKAKATAHAREFREELYELSETSEYMADPRKAFVEAAKKRGIEPVMANNVYPSTKAMNNIGPEKELIASLFTLTESSPAGKTIVGNNGAFIAFLTDRVESKPASFEDSRKAVEKALTESKSKNRVREAVANFTLKLSDSKNPVKDFDAVAKSEKGEVASAEGISMMSELKTPVDYLARELAMNTPDGKLSAMEAIPGGMMLVFVEKRTQPDAKTLEETKFNAETFCLMKKRQTAGIAAKIWVMTNSENYIQKDGEAAE